MAMPGIFRHMIKSGWCFAILRSRARHHDQYVRACCVCVVLQKLRIKWRLREKVSSKTQTANDRDDDDDARL